MSIDELWCNWDHVYRKSFEVKYAPSNLQDKIKLWGLKIYLQRENILADKILLNQMLKEIQNVFNAKTFENISLALQSWSLFILALKEQNQLSEKKIALCQVPFIPGIKKSVTVIIPTWIRLCSVVHELEDHWDSLIITFLKSLLNYSPKHVGFCITAIVRGNTVKDSEDTIKEIFNPITENTSVLCRFPKFNSDFLEKRMPQLCDIFFESLSGIPELKPEEINSLVNPKLISRSYIDAYQAMTNFLSERTSKLIHPSQTIIDLVQNLFLKVGSELSNVNDVVFKTVFLKVFLISMDSTILASQKFRLSAKNRENFAIYRAEKLSNLAITPVVAIFTILLQKSGLMFERFSMEAKNLFDACFTAAQSNLFALDNYSALAGVLDIYTASDQSPVHISNCLMVWNLLAIRISEFLEQKDMSDSFSSNDCILEIAAFPILWIQKASGIPNAQVPYSKSITEAWCKLMSSIRQKCVIPAKWESQMIQIVKKLTENMSWFAAKSFSYLVKNDFAVCFDNPDDCNYFLHPRGALNFRAEVFKFFDRLNSFLTVEQTKLSNINGNKNESLGIILAFSGSISAGLNLETTERYTVLKFISNCAFLNPDEEILKNVLKHYKNDNQLIGMLKERPDMYNFIYTIIKDVGFSKSVCRQFGGSITPESKSSKRQSIDSDTSVHKRTKRSVEPSDSNFSPNNVDLFVADSPVIVKSSKRVSFGPDSSISPVKEMDTSTQKSSSEKLIDCLKTFSRKKENLDPRFTFLM
eukprot:NODE_4_length_77007_cov_1.156642.p4 type:complete len:755 gc:universal NODE_4_length_77007_cov_1.156642:71120-68856(-)